MRVVDIKNNTESLKDFFKDLEQQTDQTVIVTDNGKAVFKISSMEMPRKRRKRGVAEGKIVIPDNLEAMDKEVADLFLGSS